MTDQRKGDHAEPTTHFGYQDVPESQKAKKVAEVFHSVAAKYDLMNDVLSGGMHRLWKRFTIELSGVRSGNRVLDIAGGTGDLAAKFSRLVGPTGQVVLADINDSMLKVGRDRLLDRGVAGNIEVRPGRRREAAVPGQPLRLRDHRFRPAQRDPQGRSHPFHAAGAQAWWPPVDPGVLQADQQVDVQGLRRLFVRLHAAGRQADHQRRGKLPLPGRIDPHAPRPGNAQEHDGRGWLRPRHLPQHDQRHRRRAPGIKP